MFLVFSRLLQVANQLERAKDHNNLAIETQSDWESLHVEIENSLQNAESALIEESLSSEKILTLQVSGLLAHLINMLYSLFS